jgi:hypothetical protein
MRALYRIYLYVVVLFLLFFAAIATAIFLGTVFSATPLNGESQRTLAQAEVVRPAVFAVLAWLIAALLGGLHYWLIRRDQASDAQAGAGAVRALFLNLAEFAAALTTLIAGTVALSGIGRPFGGGFASEYAIALVFLGLFALLEAERRRAQAGPGAALVMQRIHFYGMQLVALLFFVIGQVTSALHQTLLQILLQTGLLTCLPGGGIGFPSPATTPSCFVNEVGTVDVRLLAGAWAAAAFAVVVWIGHGLLAQRDMRSTLRQVVHFAGYAAGVIALLFGIERAAELLLRAAFGITPSVPDFAARYEFLSPALFGAGLALVYALWLTREAGRGPLDAHTMGLSALAVTAGLLAVPFWVGCGLVLYRLIERVSPGVPQSTAENWAISLALVLTGVAYIPAALRLRQRSLALGIRTPRRGFGLILLAAGIATGALALVFLLFTLATAALGSPLGNWQELARSAASALAIGLVVVGIYVQQARSEGWWVGTPATPAVVIPAPAPPAAASATPSAVLARTQAIGAVLDDLLAGRVTREAATARIEELVASRA